MKDSRSSAIILIGHKRFDLFLRYFYENIFSEYPVYLFLDGVSDRSDQLRQDELRKTVNDTWIVHSQKTNIGLRSHIVKAVDRVAINHSHILVIEDDIVISKNSLQWMESYFPLTTDKYLSFFNPMHRMSDTLDEVGFIWGWAISCELWRKYRMQLSQMNGETYGSIFFNVYKSIGLLQALYYAPLIFFSIKGHSKSWAYSFMYWRLLSNIKAITPSESLSSNSGIGDQFATHTKFKNRLSKITVSENINYGKSLLPVTNRLPVYLGVGWPLIAFRLVKNHMLLLKHLKQF